MTPEQRTQAILVAANYLAERPQLGTTGVVILFNDEAIGWMNTLRDPQNWQPGALAIDTQGNLWIATGGDSYSGAGQWQPLDDEQHQEQHQEPEQNPATAEPIIIPPALRQEKHQHIRVVFDGALHSFHQGEDDTGFDGLIKLQGMAAAFHGLDHSLHQYASDCVTTLMQFLNQRDQPDFTTWAIGQACQALRVAA